MRPRRPHCNDDDNPNAMTMHCQMLRLLTDFRAP